MTFFKLVFIISLFLYFLFIKFIPTDILYFSPVGVWIYVTLYNIIILYKLNIVINKWQRKI